MCFTADHFKNKAVCISIFAAIGTACFIVVCASTSNTVRCMFLLISPLSAQLLIFSDIFTTFAFGCIYGISPLVLMWVANVICFPAEKRAVAIGLVNALGNTASIYGVFLWPDHDAPRYIPGFRYVPLFLCAVWYNVNLLTDI